MGRVVLFGGIGSDFAHLSTELLLRGQQEGALVLLLQNEDIASYLAPYSRRWAELASTFTILLSHGTVLDEEMRYALKRASVLLVGPGKTMKYREALQGSVLGDIVVQRVREGAVYAGISAGAVLAGQRLARDTESGVGVFPALDLVHGACIEPHYDQDGKSESLRYQLEHTGCAFGIGLDNAAGIEISQSGLCQVFGEGLCTVLSGSWTSGSCERTFRQGDSLDLSRL